MIQTKQYKGNKNIETGKQKEKDSSNALKPVGMKCFFCKKHGHMKKECKGYKKWLDKQKAKGNTNEILGFIRKRLPSKDEVQVFLGNGDKVQVDFIGVLRIELEFGFILDLEDVLYVPYIRKNLISVARLVKSKFTLNFDDLVVLF
ncbi:uncharacterized protein LOC109950779 [Prunus persica]|uniref:uncharacterized protein LOC109950779 n=1 Tax=Prunus persica TaxID=3760 RepID=UPI0009AB3333|nr:uncharacterized protein LOC109950779 [Prunus persica]